MTKLYPFFRLLSILLAVTILITPFRTWPAYAQETGETSWEPPVNLSNSGLTTSPGIVSDQNGVVHAVWLDETYGTMYSQLVDGVWSQPVAAKFPFSGFVPYFVNGGDFIHAFWLNTNNNVLSHSRIATERFGSGGTWDRVNALARGVEDFEVAYQADNNLHLAFLTSFEGDNSAAGTYYMRSIDGGGRWEAAKPIYTSRYFRALNPAVTNVDIAATVQDGKQSIYLIWNNPALKRIFLARSSDNGDTWEEPFEVDGPSLANTTNSPYNPMISATDSDILLLWQSNLQSGFACTQYYQWSNDGGATWSERTRMLTEFVGCAQENLLTNINQDLTLLQTTIRDEVYMLAWNGEAWSKVYPQNTLTSFNNPLTNEPVNLSCRQSTVQLGKTLYVVGCNEEGNNDVWVTSRDVGAIDAWFPLNSLWEDTTPVVESDLEISSAQTIVDVHEVLHIFWRQADDIKDDKMFRSIHYARFKDNSLSQPARVLTSPDKMVEDFSVAYDRSRDRLVVVWTSATTGEISFSWADVSRAVSTFEWSKVISLPEVRPLAKSPNLLITPDGTIYVAYAIPVNEERGIYLVSSSDGGVNWEQPLQVYGVTEPDWQAIDFPKMASTGDEILHMVWRRERIFGDTSVVGLYYARSDNRSLTWSPPQVVANEPMHEAWLTDGGGEGVHRFWLTSSGSESAFFHDESIDQGVNWRVQENLTGFGETPGIASPFIDLGGWINFAQVVENSPDNLVINHQRYDDGRWSILDSLGLGDASVVEVTSLSAQSLMDGRLALAYTFNETEPKEGEKAYRIYLALQSEEAAQSTATAAARLATDTPPTAMPQTTLDATEVASTPVPTESVIAPTPLPVLATDTPGGQTLAMDTTTGLALSGGLAVLVVVVFFAYNRIRRP